VAVVVVLVERVLQRGHLHHWEEVQVDMDSNVLLLDHHLIHNQLVLLVLDLVHLPLDTLLAAVAVADIKLLVQLVVMEVVVMVEDTVVQHQ